VSLDKHASCAAQSRDDRRRDHSRELASLDHDRAGLNPRTIVYARVKVRDRDPRAVVPIADEKWDFERGNSG